MTEGGQIENREALVPQPDDALGIHPGSVIVRTPMAQGPGHPFERGGIREAGVSYQDLRDFKARATSFTAIAASSGRSLAISDTVEPERLEGAAISWELFPALGVPPGTLKARLHRGRELLRVKLERELGERG